MTPTQTTTLRPWRELKTIVDLDGNWTYPALAEKAHLSKGYVSLLLSGKRNPTRTAIRQLANALKVPASMIMPRDDQPRWAYSPTEVATMLGLDPTAVADLVATGQLKARKTQHGVLISDKALTAFLSEHDAEVPVEESDAA